MDRQHKLEGTCAPVERPSGGALAFGAVLAAVTLFVPLPQGLKIIRSRTSHGVSVLTLLLTVAMCWANMTSTVAVKWHTFTSCQHGPGCLGGLLDLLQEAASALSWTLTLGCVLSYSPAHNRRNLAATGLVMMAIGASIGSSVSLLVAQPCSTASLQLAAAYAWIASACAVIQYAPQILTTIAEGGSGSLSYTTYTLNIALGVAVAINEIDFQHDSMPVWAPDVMSVASQIAVVSLSLSYDLRKKYSTTLPGPRSRPKPVSAQATSDSQGDELSSRSPNLDVGIQTPPEMEGARGSAGSSSSAHRGFEQESGAHHRPAPPVARTASYTDSNSLKNPLLVTAQK